MEGYAQWTAEESRLAGWMPFHYYNRLWAPTPDSGANNQPLFFSKCCSTFNLSPVCDCEAVVSLGKAAFLTEVYVRKRELRVSVRFLGRGGHAANIAVHGEAQTASAQN
jgi:hypothetical protein